MVMGSIVCDDLFFFGGAEVGGGANDPTGGILLAAIGPAAG
jgi:hypothetical protein